MKRKAANTFPIRPKLIFMGTPEFAVPPLKSLIEQRHDIQAVITQPERRKGRGRKMAAPPVKQVAVEHRIEVLQPERASDEPFYDLVRKKDPDLIIVVAFGQILRKNLLTIPKWGVINIHASLLPKYRGAAPIQWAILNNESITGLTVMRMDEGLDTGPILFNAELPILKDEAFGHLHDRLSVLAGEIVVEGLARMAGNQIRETPQDDSLATYAPKIERKDSLIDWKQPASKISALIRALDPRPGAYTLLRGTELKLFSSGVDDESRLDGVPGRVEGKSGEALLVATGQGIVKVREIQYPGKKRLPAPDFLRGFAMREGTVLGD
jgi:methionyl-tRNA formyltransferase